MIILLLLAVVISVAPQVIKRESPIIQGEYFIGSDPGVGNAIPVQINSQQTNISVNLYNLPLLPKTAIYVRFKNSNGFWSRPRAISHTGFGKNRDAFINSLELFIDEDPGEGKGNSVEISSESKHDINLTSFPLDKDQKLYARVKDSEGRYSIPVAFIYPQRWIRTAEIVVNNDPSIVPYGQGGIMESADGLFDNGFESIFGQINNWNKKDTIWIRAQSSDYLWSEPTGTILIAPTVETNHPSFVSSASATIEGTVNPNGFSTVAYFAWDTTEIMNNSNFTSSQNISGNNNTVIVSETLENLEFNKTYYYKIIAENGGGKTEGDIINFTTIPVSVESANKVPEEFSLSQNYPNPFNPTTTISYTLPYSSYVLLRVFNTLGEEVAVLVNEEKHAGNYKLKFNGADLPSGIYFYKIIAGDFSQTKKMLLLR